MAKPARTRRHPSREVFRLGCVAEARRTVAGEWRVSEAVALTTCCAHPQFQVRKRVITVMGGVEMLFSRPATLHTASGGTWTVPTRGTLTFEVEYFREPVESWQKVHPLTYKKLLAMVSNEEGGCVLGGGRCVSSGCVKCVMAPPRPNMTVSVWPSQVQQHVSAGAVVR